MSRVKTVVSNNQFITDMLTTGHEARYVITEGLPDDAIMIGADMRADGTVVLTYQSETFEDQPAGEAPEMYIIAKTLDEVSV